MFINQENRELQAVLSTCLKQRQKVLACNLNVTACHVNVTAYVLLECCKCTFNNSGRCTEQRQVYTGTGIYPAVGPRVIIRVHRV